MAKKKIAITLEENLLKRIDQIIDGKQIRNRSHAIEFLISQSLKPKISQALILAAGKGVRWRPLTSYLPKALIPIGKKPILEIIIDHLKNYSVKNIFIVIGTLGEKIKKYFGSGKDFGVKIQYILDKKETGTAQALNSAKNFLKKEPFFLWYVDELAEIDLEDFANFHLEQKTIGTVALSSITKPSLEYGIVKIKGSKIVEFLEKPEKKKARSYLVNAGIFIFENEIFNYIFPQDKSLEKDIFPRLISEQKLAGYVFGEKWFDVGFPQNYLLALKEWA